MKCRRLATPTPASPQPSPSKNESLICCHTHSGPGCMGDFLEALLGSGTSCSFQAWECGRNLVSPATGNKALGAPNEKILAKYLNCNFLLS